MAAVPARGDMLRVIRRLRLAGYRVAALTNNWKAHRSDARGRGMQFLDRHFDLILESCVVHVRKPAAEFFQRACAALQVQPQECIFLDDIRANIHAARAQGLHTIHVPLGRKQQWRHALAPLARVCSDAGIEEFLQPKDEKTAKMTKKETPSARL
jgi:epoxide hydrolase-like predicted phosphatase